MRCVRDNEVMLAEPRPRIVGVENHLREGPRPNRVVEGDRVALSGVTQAESGHLAFVDAADIDRTAHAGVWRVGFGRPPASMGGERRAARISSARSCSRSAIRCCSG